MTTKRLGILSKWESLGQHTLRVKREGIRKPLRSGSELAKELGITAQKLGGLLKAENAPKAKYRTSGNGKTNTWFDPEEVKKWYKTLDTPPGV